VHLLWIWNQTGMGRASALNDEAVTIKLQREACTRTSTSLTQNLSQWPKDWLKGEHLNTGLAKIAWVIRARALVLAATEGNMTNCNRVIDMYRLKPVEAEWYYDDLGVAVLVKLLLASS
jgi:hypothetical protein